MASWIRVEWLVLLFHGFMAAVVGSLKCLDDTTRRPNIVFILLDDLGWGDISFTTGQFPTPHIDSLFTNGVQLTRHYVHLMCSPSRTQFLTGRYAMNLGFGVFQPWDDSEIGGIPIGQPTVANWLSEFGHYTTYAVGKWHLGYANRQLLPSSKGFDHFFGFYQGAIDYATKSYHDIERGDVGIFDFWEDGDPKYDVIDSDTLTMTLYSEQIQMYLETESVKQQEQSNPTPFYLYFATQSMHDPFPEIDAFDRECWDLVKHDAANREYKRQRRKYCALLLLTDSIIGDLIDTLKANHLWNDTLIVFTSDNGGETAYGASNYPFRGTKGELFEGNIRVLTALSGGVIEKAQLGGQSRSEMVSNLDWTPTLLEFAGYLECINPADYSWDGQSQYDLIMNYQAMDDSLKRDHLVLNIGDESLQSASIIMHHEDALYKYIRYQLDSSLSSSKSSSSESVFSVTDRWPFSESTVDVWSSLEVNGDNDGDDGNGDNEDIDNSISISNSLEIERYDASDPNSWMRYSQQFGNEFLFDLSNDEAELYNLLDPDTPNFNDALNAQIVDHSIATMTQFVDEHELFSRPLSLLHSRLEEGDPSLKFDGLFIRPFLSNKRYSILLKRIFLREQKKGYYHSQSQQDLYLIPWQCPPPIASTIDDMDRVEILEMSEHEILENEETIDSDDDGIIKRPKWPVLGPVIDEHVMMEHDDKSLGIDSPPLWPVLGTVTMMDSGSFDDFDDDNVHSTDSLKSNTFDEALIESRPKWPALGMVQSDSADDDEVIFESLNSDPLDSEDFLLRLPCGGRWKGEFVNKVMLITVHMANDGDITLDACSSNTRVLEMTAYDATAGFLMGFARSDCTVTVLDGLGQRDYIFAVYRDDAQNEKENGNEEEEEAMYDIMAICSSDDEISAEKEEDNEFEPDSNSNSNPSTNSDHQAFGHWDPSRDHVDVSERGTSTESTNSVDGDDGNQDIMDSAESNSNHKSSDVENEDVSDLEQGSMESDSAHDGVDDVECISIDSNRISTLQCPLAKTVEQCLSLPNCKWKMNEELTFDRDEINDEYTKNRPLWPVLGEVDRDSDERNTHFDDHDSLQLESDSVGTEFSGDSEEIVGQSSNEGNDDHESVTTVSLSPTPSPSRIPSVAPSPFPSRMPSNNPTRGPTQNPSNSPTLKPSMFPSGNPSISPTTKPTVDPTISPSDRPSIFPTSSPTMKETPSPSLWPTQSPFAMNPIIDWIATNTPTVGPSLDPTSSPTQPVIAVESVPFVDDKDTNHDQIGDEKDEEEDQEEETVDEEISINHRNGDESDDEKDSVDSAESEVDELEQNSNSMDRTVDGGSVFLVILIVLAVISGLSLCVLYFCFNEKYESIKEWMGEWVAKCKCWSPQEAQYWIHDEYDLITSVEGPDTEEEGTGYGAVEQPMARRQFL